MNLAAYLAKSGTPQKALADRANISQSTISGLIRGTRKPSLKTAKRIALATKNEVTVRELRPDWDQAA